MSGVPRSSQIKKLPHGHTKSVLKCIPFIMPRIKARIGASSLAACSGHVHIFFFWGGGGGGGGEQVAHIGDFLHLHSTVDALCMWYRP